MADSHVIVGTDGSGVSLRAVEWAAREAALRDRPLRIVSVPALPPRMSWYQHSGPPAVADIVHERAEEAVAGAAARAAAVEPGVAVSTAVLPGAPSDVLAQTADGAAMLVVGSRGGGGFAALLLGSVGRDVAFTADCPVVVVREEAMAGHRQVVIGVHDGPQASALGFAFEEAQRRLARLQVVYGWQIFLPGLRPGRGGEGGSDAQRGTPEAARWLAGLIAPWRQKYPAVDVAEDSVHASPSRVLVGASARADLVVLGRDGGGPDSGNAGSGALAHAMLNHAHCPVAIIPESA
jgi:nucleotide-binding universal stress UspA family protein